MTETYVVKPVYKALQVLIALGEAMRPLTLTEICHLVRLPKTTVFRYLQTLTVCGFISHDPHTDLYQLGARLFELGQLAGRQLRLRDVALPTMAGLRDRFNETVNLGILDGYDVVYVEMVESRHSLRMQATLGSRDPAYSTALGKAMLGFIDEPLRHVPVRLPSRTVATLGTRGRGDQCVGPGITPAPRPNCHGRGCSNGRGRGDFAAIGLYRLRGYMAVAD
jgi:IclR family acetate operon transcriptional repressor